MRPWSCRWLKSNAINRPGSANFFRYVVTSAPNLQMPPLNNRDGLGRMLQCRQTARAASSVSSRGEVQSFFRSGLGATKVGERRVDVVLAHCVVVNNEDC